MSAIRVTDLAWRKVGTGWQLFARRRCFGKVVPDGQYLGMWRSVLSGDRRSDMANLSWAKDAVLAAAIREIEWDLQQGPANDPPIAA